jgi:AcrR family transcriptional regulator
VLAAAIDVLEEVGYARLTIERVAARAAVAKSTIYRWWDCKGTLVMDAYRRAASHRMPEPDTGTLEGDLTAYLRDLYRVMEYPARVQALRGLIAEAQLDPAFSSSFLDWVRERRAVVVSLLQRGIERQEIPSVVDLEHAVDLIFGPFWYRLLAGHAELDPAEAGSHVQVLLHGLRGRVAS